ncbi:protein transport protein gos1 [Malassezia equina]|uniref:Protein transport protein gos1 n=1 Tax=Malassezia equina TaxID=1381935 RepID=A0AAF0IZ33_9BASI|nr:protein transport protein gos1 [Malassezia equina]
MQVNACTPRSSTVMAWEELARRVRQTQSKLDAKLLAYSHYVSDVVRDPQRAHGAPACAVSLDMSGNSRASFSTDGSDSAAMEAAIQELLVQYADDQEDLSRSMNDMADPLLPPSQTQLRTVQRHRELLVESERDFFRSKTSLRQALDRQQLLGHVRDDIDQAYATQAEFRAQRDTLSNTLTRLTSITGQVPGLQSLISLIARRRRRDTVILALVLGVCLVLLLWTGFRHT